MKHSIPKYPMLFDALCCRFAIMGEALYPAGKTDSTIQVTDKQEIIGLRHIIVHDYGMVRPLIFF